MPTSAVGGSLYGGPGACSLGKNCKICAVKLVQSQGNPLHYRAQNYRRLMLGCQKGKNCREGTEKQQRIALKRLVKQKNCKKIMLKD